MEPLRTWGRVGMPLARHACPAEYSEDRPRSNRTPVIVCIIANTALCVQKHNEEVKKTSQ